MEIEVRNLSHIYMPGSPFQVAALQDVSLTLTSGELTGIIGRTGSGKSTLVQHLNGLLRPTAGEVLVDGESIWSEKYGRRRLRRQVGMCFQFPEEQLFEETVAVDVAFGLKGMDISEDEKKRRVDTALLSVGLDPGEYRERSPLSLSGGEKRRAALAGVLAMMPEVLILDEPTAGLDPSGKREIINTIMSLHQERGITVVLVTHSMDIAAGLCRRLLVMDHGRLLLDGPPKEIFQREEDLVAAGLDLPPVTRVMKKLSQSGWGDNSSIFDLETAVDAIQKYLKEGSR